MLTKVSRTLQEEGTARAKKHKTQKRVMGLGQLCVDLYCYRYGGKLIRSETENTE